MWNARRILKELADSDRRRDILAHFWRHAETHHRLLVQAHLAKALNFREETIRKMPPEKKAELLASRIGVPEFDQFLEMALMQYHTHEKAAMLGAFLDRWNVPHENGSIEADDYTVILLRASLWSSEEEYALRLVRTFGRDQLKKRSDKERIVLKFSYVVDLFVFMLAYEAFLRQAGKRPEVSFPSFKDKAVVRQIVFEDDLAAEESMLAANSAAAQG